MKYKDKKLDDIRKIHEEIKFLTKSEIRLEILKCLEDGPLTVKEIVEKTGMTYSSVSSNMNKLERNSNVYKKGNRFNIDYLTRIYFDNIIDFNQSLEVITTFEEFWNRHNINNFDYDSMKNITDLHDSKLIKSTSIDIYRTYNTIKTQLTNSKRILAIFPYLHPDFPKLIEDELKKGAEIQLIVSATIYNSLMNGIDEDVREESFENGMLTVYSVNRPLMIYLAVCDDEMSLGLYKNDDSFDQNRILISSDDEATEWSIKLFNEIKTNIGG